MQQLFTPRLARTFPTAPVRQQSRLGHQPKQRDWSGLKGFTVIVDTIPEDILTPGELELLDENGVDGEWAISVALYYIDMFSGCFPSPNTFEASEMESALYEPMMLHLEACLLEEPIEGSYAGDSIVATMTEVMTAVTVRACHRLGPILFSIEPPDEIEDWYSCMTCYIGGYEHTPGTRYGVIKVCM